MDRDRFDDLTKRVALEGTSRRRVLASLGGGLMGALLSGLGARGAGAAGGGNSAAAKWCHQTFSGAAAGECTSLAARGTGPYYECGGPGHPECPEGYGCSDGACVPIENEPECDSDTPCPPCSECSDGICIPMNNTSCAEGSGVCLDGACFKVGDSFDACDKRPVGSVHGVPGVSVCVCSGGSTPIPSCDTTGDCDIGMFCAANNLNNQGQCKPGCLLD